MRTENSAIPCHDGCLIQVIPFTLERQESVPVNPSGIPVYISMEEPGRLHDAALVRIRQPDRTGGAALPVVDVSPDRPPDLGDQLPVQTESGPVPTHHRFGPDHNEGRSDPSPALKS